MNYILLVDLEPNLVVSVVMKKGLLGLEGKPGLVKYSIFMYVPVL